MRLEGAWPTGGAVGETWARACSLSMNYACVASASSAVSAAGSGLTGERVGLMTGGSSSVFAKVDDRSGLVTVASFWQARPGVESADSLHLEEFTFLFALTAGGADPGGILLFDLFPFHILTPSLLWGHIANATKHKV